MNYLKYGAGIDMALEKFDVCLSLIDDLQKSGSCCVLLIF